MNDKSNVVAAGKLKGGARVECRIVERTFGVLGDNKYQTQWLLIEDNMVVEVGPMQALALMMLAGD